MAIERGPEAFLRAVNARKHELRMHQEDYRLHTGHDTYEETESHRTEIIERMKQLADHAPVPEALNLLVSIGGPEHDQLSDTSREVYRRIGEIKEQIDFNPWQPPEETV